MEDMEISEGDILKIYNESILTTLLNFESSDKPEAYVIGGQPGSGKSAFASQILSNGDFVFINGDDFRDLHPHYYEYLVENEMDAADKTQKVVNFWIEKLIEDCVSRKLNIIIEGTMRNTNVPIKTIRMLKDKDYKINVAVMAVPYSLSLASINYRYT